MIRFLLGYALVHVTVALGAGTTLGWGSGDFVRLLGKLVLVPVVCTLIALQSATLRGPRRLFARSRRRGLTCVGLGVFTAVGTLLASTVLVAYLDDVIADTWLVAAGSLGVAATVAWGLPRLRGGRCTTCDYDLRKTWTARCPECGEATSLDEDAPDHAPPTPPPLPDDGSPDPHRSVSRRPPPRGGRRVA